MEKERNTEKYRKAKRRRNSGAVTVEGQAVDYQKYRLSWKDKAKIFGEYLVLGSVFAYLFYRSWWMAGVLWLFYPLFRKQKKQQLIIKRQEVLNREFKESIQCVANSLAAGYSIENSFRKACSEICLQCGNDSLMAGELRYFNSCLSLNVPLEHILSDFAFRSGLEDVRSFCEVFAFAKRSGGDFIHIIHMTVTQIAEKTELLEEIQTEITGKRLEQKIMNLMPLMILLYVDVSFGGYLDVLYHNTLGIAVMSACLLVYLSAYLLSRKVMDIQV